MNRRSTFVIECTRQRAGLDMGNPAQISARISALMRYSWATRHKYQRADALFELKIARFYA